jgi:hypothetical protein
LDDERKKLIEDKFKDIMNLYFIHDEEGEAHDPTHGNPAEDIDNLGPSLISQNSSEMTSKVPLKFSKTNSPKK